MSTKRRADCTGVYNKEKKALDLRFRARREVLQICVGGRGGALDLLCFADGGGRRGVECC